MMSSNQIAALNGSFQQQSMMNMQHSAMLSQYAGSGMGRGMEGDHQTTMAQSAFGQGVNTLGAVASPIATAGMMVAGMDPLSAGLSGAVSGFGRAGVMGAVGGGMAAAALPMAGLMGAQYVGSQVMGGMRESQMVRGQLSQGFGHMNSMGGRGFTGGQSSSITNFLRDESANRGPGGEFATMDELGRLASNMGRMGMAQGVKDAKDFKEKFTKMMKTVKSIAEDFSTSLEEAQKIMGSMRGAGIFGNGSQAIAASGMRQASIAGGNSMDLVSRVGNMGSQISRSIGGRGVAGMVAGTKAVTSVGLAKMSGTLTDESIFNETGLTGEAGKEAMAAKMLSRDARFLKGGRGRQLLAAISKKDGTIDMEAVDQIKQGDVSVQEMIAKRKDHLGTMSRANFVRNEGRLRGEALAAFGGQASVVSHQGWLSRKGYDVSNMDEKAMLAFQKFTGMDKDEADNQVRMLKNMRRDADKGQDRMEQDRLMKALRNHRRTTGVEGMKRKLESGKKAVNDALRKAGTEVMDSAEDMLDSFFTAVSGEYKRRVVTGTAEGVRLAGLGVSNKRVDDLLGLKRASNIDYKNMKDVYGGASLAPSSSKDGSPTGDLQFTSEGSRAGALSDYMLSAKTTVNNTAMLAAASNPAAGAQMATAAAGQTRSTADLSGIEQKEYGAFLEGKEGLAISRQILDAKTDQERKAAADSAMAAFRSGEESNLGKGTVTAQRQLAFLARVNSKEYESREDMLSSASFVAEDLGIAPDDIESTLDRAAKGIRGTSDAESLTRARQARGSIMGKLKEDVASIKDQGMGQGRPGRFSKGDIYDADGRKLEGIEALRAREQGSGYSTSSGAFNAQLRKISEEYTALEGQDTSNMTDEMKKEREGRMNQLASQTVQARVDRRKSMEDLPEKELDKIIQENGPDARAAREEKREDRILVAAGKSSKRGATLQAATSILGGELSSEDAAALYGKEGDELLRGYASSTGMKFEDVKKDKELSALLTKAASGESIDADLTGLTGGTASENLRKGVKAKQEAGAEASDPSYRRLGDINENLNKLIKTVTVTSGKSAEEIKTAIQKMDAKDQT